MEEHKKSEEMLTMEDTSAPNAENTGNLSSLDDVNEKKSRKNKNQQKNHQCQYCDRALPSQSLLATHIRVSFIMKSIQIVLILICIFIVHRYILENVPIVAIHALNHSKHKEHWIYICDGIAD